MNQNQLSICASQKKLELIKYIILADYNQFGETFTPDTPDTVCNRGCSIIWGFSASEVLRWLRLTVSIHCEHCSRLREPHVHPHIYVDINHSAGTKCNNID